MKMRDGLDGTVVINMLRTRKIQVIKMQLFCTFELFLYAGYTF